MGHGPGVGHSCRRTCLWCFIEMYDSCLLRIENNDAGYLFVRVTETSGETGVLQFISK